MVNTSIKNGLHISLNNNVKSIDKENNENFTVSGSSETVKARKIVLCCGNGIKRFASVDIKTTYAPIAVVSGLSSDAKSFVELDYFPKNCINMLNKQDGYGLAGGISLSKKNDCDAYLDEVIRKHKLLNSSIKEEYRYIGLKNEITFKNEPRGYLYHIVNSEKDFWSVIPGKFSLAFSLAPEFYRRVYKKNPKKNFSTYISEQGSDEFVSNTVWFDTLKKNKE